MSAWALIPCLRTLKAEFDRASPGRDRGADGSIGDTAHQATGVSDHLPDEDAARLRPRDSDRANEVHALDIDSTGPWPVPGWFDKAIKRIVQRHRDRGDSRLQYVIWNRQIASAARGWVWRPYSGTADPHVNHVHFSGSYNPDEEADTRPWGVYEEDDMDLTDANLKKIAKAVWDHTEANPLDPKTPGRMGGWMRMFESRANARQVQLLAALAEDDFDEQALAAAIVAGILPAIPQGAEVSTAQLQEAIVGALRELAGTEAN